MTATAHALVAGAIAARFPEAGPAIALSYTSHYIMDSIPHWDFGTNWRNRPKSHTGIYAVVETVLGLSLSYIVFGQSLPFFHWAIVVVAGLLPDWLETPWYIWFANQHKHEPGKRAGLIERYAYAFYKIPNVFHTKAQLPLGLITQIVTVAFFLMIVSRV